MNRKSRPMTFTKLHQVNTIVSMALMAIPLVGCQPKSTADSGGDASIESDSGEETWVEPLPPMGNLLIEEMYYSGAVPTAGIDRYYSDQFIELVNIADAPVMVGGLLLGDAHGSSGTTHVST